MEKLMIEKALGFGSSKPRAIVEEFTVKPGALVQPLPADLPVYPSACLLMGTLRIRVLLADRGGGLGRASTRPAAKVGESTGRHAPTDAIQVPASGRDSTKFLILDCSALPLDRP